MAHKKDLQREQLALLNELGNLGTPRYGTFSLGDAMEEESRKEEISLRLDEIAEEMKEM